MTTIEDIDRMAQDEYQARLAGGYEPDGIGLALGTQVANDPAVLWYGSDLSCITDCDDHMSEVEENSPQAVGEALARRLSTPHGQILNDEELLVAVGEDPDYGHNLSNLLNVGIDAIEIMAHQDLSAAECMKDDRVSSAAVTITQRSGNEFDVLVYGTLKSGESYSQVLPIANAEDVLKAERP
jgi:hypothetical protein